MSFKVGLKFFGKIQKKIFFFVPIEKEVPKIDKYGKESVVTIS